MLEVFNGCHLPWSSCPRNRLPHCASLIRPCMRVFLGTPPPPPPPPGRLSCEIEKPFVKFGHGRTGLYCCWLHAGVSSLRVPICFFLKTERNPSFGGSPNTHTHPCMLCCALGQANRSAIAALRHRFSCLCRASGLLGQLPRHPVA